MKTHWQLTMRSSVKIILHWKLIEVAVDQQIKWRNVTVKGARCHIYFEQLKIYEEAVVK